MPGLGTLRHAPTSLPSNPTVTRMLPQRRARNSIPSPGLSNAVLKIQIDGASAGFASGLILAAGSSTVRGLVIRGFSLDDGITVNSSGNILEGNYVGPDAAGMAAGPGNGNGIQIFGANNTVGGTAPAARNVISANDDDGVDIQTEAATGNQIRGNYSGINAAGTGGLSTQGRVKIRARLARVVGPCRSAELISANASAGVSSNVDGAEPGCRENYIGTTPRKQRSATRTSVFCRGSPKNSRAPARGAHVISAKIAGVYACVPASQTQLRATTSARTQRNGRPSQVRREIGRANQPVGGTSPRSERYPANTRRDSDHVASDGNRSRHYTAPIRRLLRAGQFRTA